MLRVEFKFTFRNIGKSFKGKFRIMEFGTRFSQWDFGFVRQRFPLQIPLHHPRRGLPRPLNPTLAPLAEYGPSFHGRTVSARVSIRGRR